MLTEPKIQCYENSNQLPIKKWLPSTQINYVYLIGQNFKCNIGTHAKERN